MISEKVQVATTMRPKVAMLTSGMDRSVVAMKRGNARGARGAGHPLYDPFIVANRQRDEPLGCSGGRQPSSGGTSRMTGDRLVRICEGSRVKFLRSTRHSPGTPNERFGRDSFGAAREVASKKPTIYGGLQYPARKPPSIKNSAASPGATL